MHKLANSTEYLSILPPIFVHFTPVLGCLDVPPGGMSRSPWGNKMFPSGEQGFPPMGKTRLLSARICRMRNFFTSPPDPSLQGEGLGWGLRLCLFPLLERRGTVASDCYPSLCQNISKNKCTKYSVGGAGTFPVGRRGACDARAKRDDAPLA